MSKLFVTMGVAAMLLAGCGSSTSMPSYSDVTGVYRTLGPAASSQGIEMTLYMNEDHSADMSSDYMNGEPPVVESGTWIIEGDGSITVRLNETGGVTMYPVITIIFRLDDQVLESVSWDRMLYGSDGLTMGRI